MSTLKQLQGDVARRMRYGDSFATVEEQVIDPSALSDEEKAALWLYGWSFVSHRRQRREAVAHIDRLERRRTGPAGGRRRSVGPRPPRAVNGPARANLQRTVRRVLDDRLTSDEPALRTTRKGLIAARADLEGAVRDHHNTLRRSGLRPS